MRTQRTHADRRAHDAAGVCALQARRVAVGPETEEAGLDSGCEPWRSISSVTQRTYNASCLQRHNQCTPPGTRGLEEVILAKAFKLKCRDITVQATHESRRAALHLIEPVATVRSWFESVSNLRPRMGVRGEDGTREQ